MAGAGCILVGAVAGCGESLPPGDLTAYVPVAKGQCGVGDRPETDLQGRVPFGDRESGRSQEAYNCNLDLVGQYQGEGASWQFAWFEDCGYYGTANTANQTNAGVVVVDVSDPTAPRPTAFLDTIAMLDPWESLKVDESRQILVGVYADEGSGGPEIDVYDLSADCRDPKLLASGVPLPNGLQQDSSQVGHAGGIEPGGLTYYGTTVLQKITAIDLADPTQPTLITEVNLPVHDLTISADGTRAYAAQMGAGNVPTAPGLPSGTPPHNGLAILDTTLVKERAPAPTMPVVGSVYWQDGSVAQNAFPVTIGGRPYVIFTDEQGPAGLLRLVGGTDGLRDSCDQGLPPWGMARIIDISNEALPTVVSRILLEVNDPTYCDMTIHDVSPTDIFGYDSHYCNVDDPADATILACSYFQSGIRVFDIRDPAAPREIAYYNPGGEAGKKELLNASSHVERGGDMTADWCSAQIRIDATTGRLWTTCQDNGFMVLQFTNGVWPFTEATPRAGVPSESDVDQRQFGGALMGSGWLLLLGLPLSLLRLRRLLSTGPDCDYGRIGERRTRA